MKKLIALLVVTLLSAAPLSAGPLMKNQVSSTANWVVHADFERFNSSNIGQLIRKELVVQGIEEKLANFANIFSFHPINDVRDVTLYGNGKERQKAVVLIDGNFDREKLESLVQMNPQHLEHYGNSLIHGWMHEEKRKDGTTNSFIMYGCLYQDKIIVMSSGLETIKMALDVLTGSAKSATDGQFSAATLNAPGVFFQAAANGVGDIAGDQQQAAVLKQTDKLGLAIGENEGKFYIDFGLAAKSNEAAQNINKVLEGIIAFGTLSGEQQPKLAEMAKKVKLSYEQNTATVGVRFESDPQTVFQFLKEQWENRKQTTSHSS